MSGIHARRWATGILLAWALTFVASLAVGTAQTVRPARHLVYVAEVDALIPVSYTHLTLPTILHV